MLLCVIGKASVPKTAKAVAAFVRNALLVTGTDRENSVCCSLGALEGLQRRQQHNFWPQEKPGLSTGHRAGLGMQAKSAYHI